jgi:predicted MFS family arabinose efflux permease
MRTEPIRAVLNGLRRRPVLQLTLACLVVLLLAQSLIGALSLAALNRLVADTTADRVEVAARKMAGNIDNGLRLGKPLAQYFGLEQLLRDGARDTRDIQGAAVTLPDGRVAAGQGQAAAGLARSLFLPATAHLPGTVSRRASGALMAIDAATVSVAVPLSGNEAGVAGALVVTAARNAGAARALVADNIEVLILVTLAVGLGLAAVFKFLVPPATLMAGGRVRFVVPLVALMLAQGVYAAYTIGTFRDGWLRVTRDNVAVVAQGLQGDLNRILGYGLALDRLRGVEAPFARLAATFPAVREVDLVAASGRVLNRANAHGQLPVTGLPEAPVTANDLTVVLPVGARSARGEARGSLVLRLDGEVLAAGVRSRVVDAVTVVVVALVAAVEMLLLLSLLMNRSFAARTAARAGGAGEAAEIGLLARPVMFGFLFAWAMPLGFLPLYARSLPVGGLNLPANILLALPISVEMACGLLTSLLAGRLTDRRGWQVPVLAGLAVSCAGMLACAAAPNLPLFAAARGLVGLGYGLTWMGLQGFVVTRSSARHRGHNMSSVIAGLFAGHLAGAAVGAMMMEQSGFRAVFAVGAAMMLMPLAGVLTLLRPYMARGAGVVSPGAAGPAPRTGLAETIRLVFTRDFGLLLLGSIIPFSIAQVGLLSFALPLYLEAEGVAASSIGRVLMIYGLCVIYLGPVMGRMIDRYPVKKTWIVVGGVVGSVGMLGLYFDSGLAAAAVAVLMLALASCFTGASQSPYMLALPDVQRYGAAGATSVMRAADKLGQMAGPLLVGAMFGTAGMGASLAVTGAIYLGATLLFLLLAPGRPAAPGR